MGKWVGLRIFGWRFYGRVSGVEDIWVAVLRAGVRIFGWRFYGRVSGVEDIWVAVLRAGEWGRGCLGGRFHGRRSGYLGRGSFRVLQCGVIACSLLLIGGRVCFARIYARFLAGSGCGQEASCLVFYTFAAPMV